jgi:hypothetical protein
MKKFSNFILFCLSGGTMPDTERIACPMCGWWRTLPYGAIKETGEIREVRFDKVDPATAKLYYKSHMTGAGRGSKKAKIELSDGKTLEDLPEAIKEQIRTQCHRILEVLE